MIEATWTDQLERIIEAIPDGVVVADAHGRVTYVNTMAEELLGLPRDDIVGLTLDDPAFHIITVNGKPFSSKELPFAQVLATGIPLYNIDITTERSGSGKKTLSINTAPFFNEAGAVSGLVVAYSDITKRKRTEEILIENDTRFRRLVELSPNPVVVHSEGKVVYINPSGLKLLGANEPEEVVGKDVLSFVHPDYVELVRDRFRQMQQGKIAGLIEEKFIRIDGEVIDVEVAASPILCRGKPAVMVIIRDITERNRAEEALRESERRFREMLEGAQLVAAILDTRGKVVFLNNFALNLTGWDKEEILGGDWFETFIPPEHREEVSRFFFETIENGSIHPHYDNEIITRWGARRMISFNNVILRDLQGRVMGTASIGQDITEQTRLLNELNSLSQITDIAMSTLNLSELLENLLKRLVEIMEADTAVILLKEGNQLVAKASAGVEEEVDHSYFIKIGHGFAGTIAKTANPLYIADAQTDPRVINPILKRKGIRSMLGVPVMRDGNLIGVLHIGWLSAHQENESEVRLLTVAADRCAMAITNAQLHEKAKESGRLINALNSITATINSSLDFDETMRKIVKEATKAMGCETAAIDLREGDYWVIKYIYGLPQDLVGTRFTDDQSKHSALAAKTRKPVVINDACHDERVSREIVVKYSLRSIMVVPLMTRETVFGVLFFSYHSTMISFSDAQVDFASKLGTAISLALDNARLHEAKRNPGALQGTLRTIPQNLPGIGIGHLYRQAMGAIPSGVDFYDLFEIAKGKIGILVGSASGSDDGAVELATMVKNAVKVHAFKERAPASVIAKTYDVVLKTAPESNPVSAFFGVLDVDTGKLIYCNAGHPPAAIKRSTSEVELLTRNSPSMGALPGSRFKNGRGTIKKGDTLIVYTDGIAEARCDGELFDAEKLVDLIKQLKPESAQDMPQAIFDEVMRCDSRGLPDDIVLLCIGLREDW